MDQAFRGIGIIRSLYLVPIMTAAVVVALTFRAMFNNDAGWINWLLGMVGLPTPVWLGDPALAMPVDHHHRRLDERALRRHPAARRPGHRATGPQGGRGDRRRQRAAQGSGTSRSCWIRPVLFVVVVLRFMEAFRKFEAHPAAHQRRAGR